MKLFLIITLAVFGLANGKSLPTQSLKDDFEDFMTLIPTDKILEIVLDYVANDKEMQDVIAYLQSEDFKSIIVEVEKLKEFNDFVDFLQEQGLEVYQLLNTIHELLGLPPYKPVLHNHISIRRGTGLTGCIDDILAILPIDDLKALFNEKLQTSPDFKNLIDALKSEEFQTIVRKLVSLPQYQDLKQRLRDKGIDIDKYIDLIRAYFGWTRDNSLATQSLKDDFEDFMALIPTDKILEIVLDYVANDKEMQDAIAYLQSEDFKSIIVEVEKLKEFNDFVDFLQEQGLEVYQLLNTIHELLGLPPYKPVLHNHISIRRGTGLTGCIDDILAILPIDDLKALFNEKLQTSPDFKNLIDALKSEEFQTIVRKLVSLPQYQDLKQRLRDKGIDIDKYIDLIRAYFGWTRGTKHSQSLEDDWQDFLALVPTDRIVEIAMDYYANDKEVQDAVAYIQSDDFKNIILAMDSLPEYIDFLNYLQESNLDVYYYLNLLHDLLGLPPLVPPGGRLARIGEPGMKGLWNAVLAELPLDKLKALFYEKLETSPEFKALVDRIKSDDFKVIVAKLQGLPEYQDLKQRLRDKGIDVDKIIEVLKSLVGWSY